MPVGAVLGAGAISAGAGVFSASKAAKAQKKASDTASATTLAMYEQTREDLQPYAATGGSSLDSIAAMYGLPSKANPTGGQAFSDSALEAFRRSPDYQVALKEGIRARDLSAASKGNLLSGGQEKRIAEYGSELASLKFGQYMDRTQRRGRVQRQRMRVQAFRNWRLPAVKRRPREPWQLATPFQMRQTALAAILLSTPCGTQVPISLQRFIKDFKCHNRLRCK